MNTEWKPIESAPKDGTEVWAYNGEQARMRWTEGECYALWIWADDLVSDADPCPDQPTHWMPLPPAPTSHPIPTGATGEDGEKVYHFEQRSRFGPWIEVEKPTAKSVEFVKRGAPATGDALAYGSPADVAQRIEQYLYHDGRKNSATQLLYEAMKALRGPVTGNTLDAALLQAMAAEWDRARRGVDSSMPIWNALCEALGEDSDGAGMRKAISAAIAQQKGEA